MKSVYSCTKPDGTLALAFDLVAIEDSKVLGALLRLAGENGLIVDRVERDTVLFEDPLLIRAARDKARDKAQIEIDFSKPAAGDRGGPSEMPEGFACSYSGVCPTPSKACATCEFASNGIPKDIKEALTVAANEATETEPTLVDDMKSSIFMQWASMSPAEREAAGIEKPEGLAEMADEPLEDIEPDEEDDSEFGQDEPRSDDAEADPEEDEGDPQEEIAF